MSKFISFKDQNNSYIFNADNIKAVRHGKDNGMIDILFDDQDEYAHFFFDNYAIANYYYDKIRDSLCE